MRGYTIQHSIDLLEKKSGSGSGESVTAEAVSYDNTTSLLTADNVQTAIDEVNTKATQALAGITTALTGSS